MKILIMGYSGSGKSTLARRLSIIYGLKILHLDSVQFLPKWEIRPQDQQERMVKDFLDMNSAWVIDGNYSKLLLERRIDEADLIIIMQFNRLSALYRVIKRYIKYRGVTRPDMGIGCNEKLDLDFIMWILRDGRNKRKQQFYECINQQNPDKVIVIKNQKQLNTLVNELVI